MSTRIPAANVKLKRAYDAPASDDGTRILIDRLWPRGVSKEEAALDQWMKEVAPSTELRHWFDHDPTLWEEFRSRYAAELREHSEEQLAELREIARKQSLTLVYAAHDEKYNNAVVLRDVLLGR